MRKIIFIMTIIVSISLIFMVGCAPKKQEPTIKQGIYGTLSVRSGNCMPMAYAGFFETIKCKLSPSCSVPKHTCKTKNKNIMIDIREPVNYSGYSLNYINSRLIAKVTSTKNGFYEIEIPPREYSVFYITSEGNVICKSEGAKDHIACPIWVVEGVNEQNIAFDFSLG